MDYSKILNEIKKASLFDLYRLHVAIGNELDNPNHIFSVKQRLRIGMKISFFHHVENRLIDATIISLNSKSVVILDHEKQTRFKVPYYVINLSDADVSIHNTHNSLDANNLKVGDLVGFTKDGKDIVGIIKRLNSKTVTLQTQNSQQWRVAYSFLYNIYKGEMNEKTLCGEVIKAIE